MGCATPEQEGMGATVVAALVSDAALLVAHLGDSRAYRLRSGHLELLTRDHNLGNALRDEGVVHDGAEDIPEYHVLRRFVGMDQPLPPDVGAFDLRQRDRYLLCSDGLTNMLDEGEIAEVLRAETPCEQICRQMVSRANEAGGYDNITVIVAEVQSVRADHVSPSKVAQTIASLDLEESPLLHETSEKG